MTPNGRATQGAGTRKATKRQGVKTRATRPPRGCLMPPSHSTAWLVHRIRGAGRRRGAEGRHQRRTGHTNMHKRTRSLTCEQQGKQEPARQHTGDAHGASSMEVRKLRGRGGGGGEGHMLARKGDKRRHNAHTPSAPALILAPAVQLLIQRVREEAAVMREGHGGGWETEG